MARWILNLVISINKAIYHKRVIKHLDKDLTMNKVLN
jgi:hypothetical protein